jgi:hypothetical protein
MSILKLAQLDPHEAFDSPDDYQEASIEQLALECGMEAALADLWNEAEDMSEFYSN